MVVDLQKSMVQQRVLVLQVPSAPPGFRVGVAAFTSFAPPSTISSPFGCAMCAVAGGRQVRINQWTAIAREGPNREGAQPCLSPARPPASGWSVRRKPLTVDSTVPPTPRWDEMRGCRRRPGILRSRQATLT
jgi:hypothetical protein